MSQKSKEKRRRPHSPLSYSKKSPKNGITTPESRGPWWSRGDCFSRKLVIELKQKTGIMEKLRWPIELLHKWDKNPKDVLKPDFERLKKQISDLGEYKPLLIMPEGKYDVEKGVFCPATMIGGNTRLEAYSSMGIKKPWVSILDFKQVDGMYHAFIDGQKQKRGFTNLEAAMLTYSISDNDEVGRYNAQSLAEIATRNKVDIDIKNLKVNVSPPVDVAEIINMFGPDPDEDDPPERDRKDPPISKMGAIYQVGRHFVMCGDSTKLDDVTQLMNGVRADMCFTDPPYLMDFSGSVHSDGKKSFNAKHGKIKNDSLSEEDAELFITSFLENMLAYTKGGFYVCWYRLGLHKLFAGMDKIGLDYHNLIIWHKNNFTLSMSDYNSKYEPMVYGWANDDYTPILYGWNDEHHFYGKKGETDIWELPAVWSIDRTKKNDLHPTMKPIALLFRALKNSSKPGEVVLDLFGGSGSTLIACEQLDRTCYMMEFDPYYVDAIRARYGKFIGKEKEWQEVTPQIN